MVTPESGASRRVSWQHQKELDLTAEQVLPRSEATCVAAFWEVLSLFHRSSNLAESLHSWLRPYLQVHRGIPVWLLPLLQIFWNHHPFQRGERQGKSPLALAGVDDVPTLAELFDRLVGRQPSIRAPDFFCQKYATRFQPKFETFRNYVFPLNITAGYSFDCIRGGCLVLGRPLLGSARHGMPVGR